MISIRELSIELGRPPSGTQPGTAPDSVPYLAGFTGFTILLDDHIGHNSRRLSITHTGAVPRRSWSL